MRTPPAPRLEERRAAEFAAELRERARAWIPAWGLADGEGDFGRAVLDIAARFSSEVAERLDGAGDKMRRGFLDWLGVRGDAARAARMPVVFKLADTARDAVLASAPVRMQVDAAGTNVVFETETDVRLVPGQLESVVAVDADLDAFYLPPPALSDLAPLEPLPTEWQLKSFAAAGAQKLQLDPESGLVAEMIVEVAGQQYRIAQVDKDIVTIEPGLMDELPAQTSVHKVTAFAPFTAGARNRQEHALYLGHMELLDIEAAATLEIVGAQQLGANVAWQYWANDEAGWQSLSLAPEAEQKPDAVVLKKPRGALEPRALGAGNSSRWIRAFALNAAGAGPSREIDGLAIRVNCTGGSPTCPPDPDLEEAAPIAEAMANTTPLVLESVFFPLGKEPRQFDAFYLGSQEAFSKKGAEVRLCLEMADPTFSSLAVLREGILANTVLAGVAKDGALHLLEFQPATGSIGKFRARTPLQPPLPGYLGNAEPGSNVALDRQPAWRLPIWFEPDVLGGGLFVSVGFAGFLVAVSAGAAIWVWHERSLDSNNSGWVSFDQLPADGSVIDGLVYLAGVPAPPIPTVPPTAPVPPAIAALCNGELFLRDWPNGPRWNPVTTWQVKSTVNEVVALKSIVPVLVQNSAGALVTSIAAGMVGISTANELFHVASSGRCEHLLKGFTMNSEVRPVAVKLAGALMAAAFKDGDPMDLTVPPKLIAYRASGEESVDLDAKVVGALEAVIKGNDLFVLASVGESGNGRLVTWEPFASGTKVESPVAASGGQIGGGPTAIDRHVVIPGAHADVLVADFDPSAVVGDWHRDFSDASANPELSWEYWNGKGWWKLDITLDQTLNLRNTGVVQFKVPPDIESSDWAGKTNYWIRARLIGGDYGREKVTVTSAPTATPDVTQQTVERSSAGIRAPSVMKLHISYGVCDGVVPTFVLAQDSGSLRDQSDANRTAGAIIEAFVPLAVTLGRLSTGVTASKAPDDCPPDCDCSPTGATAATTRIPESPSSDAAPVSATGRALFIGLRATLSGAPVNVLLLVDEERDHGSFAPLTIEAMVANRFVPIVASDTTRALGESGLLSMTFTVPPTPRELFGQTLTWLRLTPAPSATPGDWLPTLRGAYLNAVWASAAETLTRELVGSSDGAPDLTLHLARPPVLLDSLELRVKEPLGDEERAALRADDESRVLSAVDELPGDWVRWTRVIDPGDEPATARVYALDEANGEIRFGDGQHGMIPPIGRDAIVAFSYRRTEQGPPGSTSVPANAISARTALNLVSPVESVEAVFAADQAAGGAPPETHERVLRFGGARLRHRNRAVTADDLADLALQSSPDVVQARCFARRGYVRLVIVMRGKDPRPNAAQVRELRRLLLAAAPAGLSAPNALRIEGPSIRRLRVGLWLRVATLDRAGALARVANDQLAALFDTATGGAQHEGWPLGENPNEGDIAFALLDAPHLDGIAKVALLESPGDRTERAWPDKLKPTELVMLAEDPVRIQFVPAEVVA